MTTKSKLSPVMLYLITEYCPGPLFMGWHLYLRESRDRRRRNSGVSGFTMEGEWGWSHEWHWEAEAKKLLAALGLRSVADDSTDGGMYAGLARLHPIGREKIGGKPRGCVPVKIVEHDGFEHIELAEELSAGAGVDCEGAEMTDLVKAKCGHFVRVVRGPGAAT